MVQQAEIIGDYQLEKPLRPGVLGQVYYARHVTFDWRPAVKIFHAALASDPRFRQRFDRDMTQAAALRHPHIIEVFTFGERDGRLYLAMERASEESLRTLRQHRAGNEQAWPLFRVIDLVRQAADALAFAHERGVIHRNIKPTNLLLARQENINGHPPDSPFNGTFTLKVSDFALTQTAEETLEQPENQIAADTLAYAAPEWFQGQELDTCSDIYALGVVLYELATGYLPFDARNFNLAWQKHYSTPLPAPRQVSPYLSTELEAIILQCLAKNPSERFTAAELSAALQVVVGKLRPAPPPEPKQDAAIYPAATPQVKVLDQQRQTLKTIALTGDGLTVGRADTNDIQLPADMIAAQHLQIDWDGNQVTVTALDRRHTPSLEGVPLPVQEPRRWGWDRMLRVGPFWLRLERAPAMLDALLETREVAPAAPPSEPVYGDQPDDSSATVNRIRVVLDQDRLEITPGQPTAFGLTLANLGTNVDHYTVKVEGIPEGWVAKPAPYVKLNPEEQSSVALQIMVPRVAESRADDYPVLIRAQSEKRADESGTSPAIWTVLPFSGSTLRIEPRQTERRWRQAPYTAVIQNTGNAPAQFQLAEDSEEDNLTCHIPEEPVSVAAGRTAHVRLHVTPKRLLWRGEPRRHRFSVRLVPKEGKETQTASAHLRQRPIITWVVILIAALLLGLTVLALWYLFWPRIEEFRPAIPQPVKGDPLLVYWRATNARRVELWSDSTLLSSDFYTKTNDYTFTGGQTGGYQKPPSLRLVVKNQFGIAAERRINVELITPSPTPVTPTPRPTATPFPSPTPEPPPTATPQPPTATPQPPTATPTRTPIPPPPPCPQRYQVYEIRGTGTPGDLLKLFFDDRQVGGRTVGRNGRFNIPLVVGDEALGDHRISVRRNGQEIIGWTCRISR